jgi:translation elongation factor EF-Ts
MIELTPDGKRYHDAAISNPADMTAMRDTIHSIRDIHGFSFFEVHKAVVNAAGDRAKALAALKDDDAA